MQDNPYSKREIDFLTETLGDKIQNVQNVLELRMSDNHKLYADSLSRIETQVAYTNGKVKKITIGLVFLAGLCIGLGILEGGQFLSLIL